MTETAVALDDLAERLRHIPVMYGVNGSDVDALTTAAVLVDVMHDLIEQLVIEEPIFHEAYEGFNDQCVFCGIEPGGTGPQVHKDTCMWIAGADFLGRERPHHIKESEVT